MRNARVLTVLLVGLIATGYWLLTPGQAQPAPALPRCAVAVVNIPQVFRDSKEFKAVLADFEKRGEQLKANADAQQKALADRAEDIRKRFDPSSKDYRDRMRELLTERIRYRVTLEEQSNDMKLEHQRALDGFYARVSKIVEDVAREEGFDVVFYKEEFQTRNAEGADELLAMIRQRKVLYNSTRADITEKVIRRLDAAADAGKPN